MKKFLPVFLAVLLALPVLAQQSARESLQAMHQRQVGTETPGKHIHFPAAASRNQPFNFTTQRAPREKNMRVLKQQLDSYVYQRYDASTSSWINNALNEFTYDGSGNNTGNIYSYWNPDTEAYEITGKDEFTYVNGNLSEQVHFDWDAGENRYVQVFQWTFAYNGDGNMTIGYTSLWNGSGWEVAVRDDRIYDAAGNMVLQIYSWWDSTGNEWINDMKTGNSYNGSGALLVSTSSVWDLLSGGWRILSRSENTYNASEQVMTSNLYSWNADSSQWVNFLKEEFTYDGNMNMVMYLYSEWNDNQWLNYYQIKMAYNDGYTSDEIILPWMFTGELGMLGWIPVHLLTGTTEYEYSGESFVLTSRGLYNYSQVNLTAIAEPENSQALIYPQPASDLITFSWDINQPTLGLGIYDSNGKKVLSQQLDNHGSVNVDHLAPGLYIYRLDHNHKTKLTGKISVR